MKTFLTATVFSALASSVYAEDFDHTKFNLELYRDNTIVKVETVQGEATELSLGAYVLDHKVFGADADVFLSAGYNIPAESFVLSAEYNVEKQISYHTNVYGSLTAEYSIEDDAKTGEWQVTPLIGSTYTFNDKVAAFREVSHDFDASNDWNGTGGLVEVGLNYNVTDGVYLRPSVTRTFDTASNETNVGLTVGLAY